MVKRQIENQINSQIKRERGISLIALIITIIILVILAGIGISSLTGENGIIKNSQNSKLQTEIAAGKEKLQLLYTEQFTEEFVQNNGNNIELGDYLNYIEEQGIPTKEEDGKSYAEVDGKIYEISEEQEHIKIDYVEEGEITEPRIEQIIVVEKTASTIEIKVEALRMEGGTYYYYIGTSENSLEEKGSNQEGEYIFEESGQAEKYYIKVIAESKDGKQAEKTIEVEMEKVPEAKGNIDYEITWEDGEATVTLSTKTKYNIEVSRDNIAYTQIRTVSGLENGEYIYARLTNGEISGEEIKIDIIDSTKPEIQINVEETTTKEIRITAIATDEESGIKGKPYKYYISESTDGFKETADGQNETGSYTFKK